MKDIRESMLVCVQKQGWATPKIELFLKCLMFVYVFQCTCIPDKYLEDHTKFRIVTCENELEFWNGEKNQYFIFNFFFLLSECIINVIIIIDFVHKLVVIISSNSGVRRLLIVSICDVGLVTKNLSA